MNVTNISELPNLTTPESNMDYIKDIPKQRLPSRDIPMETTHYVNDEETQVNYIPKKVSFNFVDENVKECEKYKQQKHREKLIDKIINEIQIPFIVSFLFFLFHIPPVNSFIFKYFSFMKIYNDDGNMNTSGILFKSFLFFITYYLLIKGYMYLSDI